uniref:ATP synthase complex subunit 8 n=1 Tax=Melyridae sp. 'Dasytidae' GENSP01 TaxID=1205814 RepID=A0A0S2MPC5_9CUCU|nr:ATP synthase F0 subunit 8 [Melyridae sp. 'Dasytidae' GENSP01]
MPQMSPMNWVLLFIMFSIIFLVINANNYFMLKYTPLFTKKSLMKNKINWKW